MAHPRNRGDSSIRLSRPVRKVRGLKRRWCKMGRAGPPTFNQADLSFPSLPKFGGQKPANCTMTQAFLWGTKWLLCCPIKFSHSDGGMPRWQSNQQQKSKKVLSVYHSETQHPTDPSKLRCSKSWEQKERKKMLRFREFKTEYQKET